MVTRTPRTTESMIRRDWTRAERRIVLRGLYGRLLIAIEPAICALAFAGISAGLVIRKQEVAMFLSPIFGVAAVAFVIYGIALMQRPFRALAQTFKPIYVVDGYLRYRAPDEHSGCDSNGYVAVLDHDRVLLGEWPANGDVALPDYVRSALIEFSDFGGIHRIDGRTTGAIPRRVGPFAVGGRDINI